MTVTDEDIRKAVEAIKTVGDNKIYDNDRPYEWSQMENLEDSISSKRISNDTFLIFCGEEQIGRLEKIGAYRSRRWILAEMRYPYRGYMEHIYYGHNKAMEDIFARIYRPIKQTTDE